MASIVPLLVFTWLWSSLAAKDAEPWNQEEEEKKEQPVEQKADEARSALLDADWREDDGVIVFFAEFLLAQWVLNSAPWNAYHSGIAFKNTRTGRRALYDFCPDDTSSVVKMVMPSVSLPDQLWRVAIGDLNFTWNDRAHLAFFTGWPAHYQTFVPVGNISGSMLFKYVEWASNVYSNTYKAFNPIEVVTPPNAGNGQQGGTLLRSRMCHDFVTDSLWTLYNLNATLVQNSEVFRDHIIIYAEHIEAASVDASWIDARQELRYLRSLYLYLDKIRQQFTYAREAYVYTWRMGLPVFVHDEYGVYHRVQLTPPLINYCYLPLAIPPETYDIFGDAKLCALGMDANLTNTTTPYPWAHALASEDRLDRHEVFATLGLTSLLAAVLAAAGRAPAKTTTS
eukprot:TRINITY_DN29039_c0_g1_i1.p1 TRINITY_DN29039_c0_g1~~TRINITY_DN29039_c0_g1_i1.p1  ORF type:complete len:396 (+),score=51.99 TRINITY_DN29039_c0_g1_i1:142-1329(+)